MVAKDTVSLRLEIFDLKEPTGSYLLLRDDKPYGTYVDKEALLKGIQSVLAIECSDLKPVKIINRVQKPITGIPNV